MHPFSYGQEFYFYTLIVSVLIFGLGGGMSVYEGIMHITHPVVTEDATWNYTILVFPLYSRAYISLRIPLKKIFKVNGSANFWHKLRQSKDHAFFVVIFENGAALIGLLIAFCGVFFSSYFNLPILEKLT